MSAGGWGWGCVFVHIHPLCSLAIWWMQPVFTLHPPWQSSYGSAAEPRHESVSWHCQGRQRPQCLTQEQEVILNLPFCFHTHIYTNYSKHTELGASVHHLLNRHIKRYTFTLVLQTNSDVFLLFITLHRVLVYLRVKPVIFSSSVLIPYLPFKWLFCRILEQSCVFYHFN